MWSCLKGFMVISQSLNKPIDMHFLKGNSYTSPIWYAASTSPTCYLYQIWKNSIAADHLRKLAI